MSSSHLYLSQNHPASKISNMLCRYHPLHLMLLKVDRAQRRDMYHSSATFRARNSKSENNSMSLGNMENTLNEVSLWFWLFNPSSFRKKKKVWWSPAYAVDQLFQIYVPFEEAWVTSKRWMWRWTLEFAKFVNDVFQDLWSPSSWFFVDGTCLVGGPSWVKCQPKLGQVGRKNADQSGNLYYSGLLSFWRKKLRTMRNQAKSFRACWSRSLMLRCN